jgi:hypothetical protein
VIGDLFADPIVAQGLSALPAIVPAATIAVAKKYLADLDVALLPDLDSLTVREAVRRLMLFQLFPAWRSRNPPVALSREVAGQVGKVLRSVYKDSIHHHHRGNSHTVKEASPAPTTVPDNSPVKGAQGEKEETLMQMINKIKVELELDPIQKNTVAQVLTAAKEQLLGSDDELEEYSKLKSNTDKAKFILEHM